MFSTIICYGKPYCVSYYLPLNLKSYDSTHWIDLAIFKCMWLFFDVSVYQRVLNFFHIAPVVNFDNNNRKKNALNVLYTKIWQIIQINFYKPFRNTNHISVVQFICYLNCSWQLMQLSYVLNFAYTNIMWKKCGVQMFDSVYLVIF